jgi:excinuclease ABC subunit C
MPFDPSLLENFPSQPGVYIMKSGSETVLYIGKAKNLKKRLRQYFLPGGDGRFMVPFLTARVEDIDTVVVNSEKEALLLENTLIKKHKPKYNALLKDDKSYIALKLNNKHPWPTLSLVRYKGKPEANGVYFGPYTSAYAARNTLDLLGRLFPLRQCSDQEFARRTRPCILYDMKRCVAPCVQKCTKAEYQSLVDKSVRFIRGQDKSILNDLYREMNEASAALEFEKAAELLKSIRQIEATLEKQDVDKPLGINGDVIGIFRQGDEVVLSLLFVREGKLTGSRNYNFSNIAEDDSELVESFLLQHYQNRYDLPEEILLPVELDNLAVITDLLKPPNKRFSLLAPLRGSKRALLDMARKNAETTYIREKDQDAIREKTLLEMQQKLHLSRYPKRIECFDNSNLSGQEFVSCMIAFTDGEKDSSRYRKYKIKAVKASDDYGAMFEVLSRRYKRAQEENDLPDLLIVDGGKGHLKIALKVLSELNIINIDVISIAKEEGRHDKGITAEQIFIPNIKDPILLRHTSPILFLLQKIRDEAHRFALAFHRKQRSKKLLRSQLEDIPGIGTVKQKLLLQYFGSVKNIANASQEELLRLKGISKTNSQDIFFYFHPST